VEEKRESKNSVRGKSIDIEGRIVFFHLEKWGEFQREDHIRAGSTIGQMGEIWKRRGSEITTWQGKMGSKAKNTHPQCRLAGGGGGGGGGGRGGGGGGGVGVLFVGRF